MRATVMLNVPVPKMKKPKSSSAYHHESNGHAECAVPEMKKLLGKKTSYAVFHRALREYWNCQPGTLVLQTTTKNGCCGAPCSLRMYSRYHNGEARGSEGGKGYRSALADQTLGPTGNSHREAVKWAFLHVQKSPKMPLLNFFTFFFKTPVIGIKMTFQTRNKGGSCFKHYNFLDFDEKQLPQNFWFRGTSN